MDARGHRVRPSPDRHAARRSGAMRHHPPNRWAGCGNRRALRRRPLAGQLCGLSDDKKRDREAIEIWPLEVEECADRWPLLSQLPQIDPELLAFLVKVAALQAQRFRRVGDVLVVAL